MCCACTDAQRFPPSKVPPERDVMKKNAAAWFVRHIRVRKHKTQATWQWLHILHLIGRVSGVKRRCSIPVGNSFFKKWKMAGRWALLRSCEDVHSRSETLYRVPRIEFRKGIWGTPGFTRWVKALIVPILVPGWWSLEDVRPEKDMAVWASYTVRTQ